MTAPATAIIKAAERMLSAKSIKYATYREHFNENTEFTARYLISFLSQLGLRPEGL